MIIRGLSEERGGEAPRASPAHSDRFGIVEAMLRVCGAVLQVVATWAVVHVLSPDAAGVYFRGFVISLGFAALLRANYEIYAAYHIVAGRAAITEVSNSELLMQLGRRVLLRSSLVCALLLVITADIDIQAPRLQPALETYLPFVLAIPWVSLSSFIAEALRAANRTLYGTIVGAYVLNISILLTVVFAPPDAPVALYAWAYFGGSVIAAGLAVFFGRWALQPDWRRGDAPIPRVILQSTDERWIIGLGRAVMLWGPLCILAVAVSNQQMAYYAVAARTAMIVDFILPALNLSGGRDMAKYASLQGKSRRLLVVQLGSALFYSTIFVAIAMITARPTLRFYGNPYDSQLPVYMVLLAAQWANSVGRPAVRYMVIRWDVRRMSAAVSTAAIASMTVCGLAINSFGILAPASASLIGASLLSAWATVAALGR